MRKVKLELEARNWVTPIRESKRAGQAGGRPYSRGHIYRLLSNPLYIGKIAQGGELFPGQHPAIVDEEIWHQVQERMKANRQGVKSRTHAAEPSLLAGMLFDDTGGRFTPSHAKKGNKRYRYYIARALGDAEDQDAIRIPAKEIEDVVVAAVSRWLNDDQELLNHIPSAAAKDVRNSLRAAKEQSDQLRASPRDHIAHCLQRVNVQATQLVIELNPDIVGADDPITIEVPATLRKLGHDVWLIVTAPGVPTRTEPDNPLLALLARAQDWFGKLTSGEYKGIAEIALTEGVSRSYAARVIFLALMAPDVLQKIVRREHPLGLTAERLMRLTPLPEDWDEQRRLLRMT